MTNLKTKQKKNWCINMSTVRTILDLKLKHNMSDREISQVVGVSNSTVSRFTGKIDKFKITCEKLDSLNDEELDEIIYDKKPGRKHSNEKIVPDFKDLIEELKAHKKLTVKVLYEEYINGLDPPRCYSYSWFADKIDEITKENPLSMVLTHEKGDELYIDYAGTLVPIYSKSTGEIDFYGNVFIATLAYSGYSYLEVHKSQKLENFINGHVNAFEFFKGLTNRLRSDNLKSAVNENTRYSLILNESYLDMCNHYDIQPSPARPYKPKDKAKVEQMVGFLTRNVLMKARNEKFYSLQQANTYLLGLTIKANASNFQNKGGNREMLYKDELNFLKPLPIQRYEYSEFKLAKALPNYHILADRNYYSVPYQLRGIYLSVKLTKSLVVIYKDHVQIACHQRSFDNGKYVTNEDHMPQSHRMALQNPKDIVLREAGLIGVNTKEVIEKILISTNFFDSAIKSAKGTLALKKLYGAGDLELACQFALKICSPTRASVESILSNNLHLIKRDKPIPIKPVEHLNIRGSEYYKERNTI